MNFDRLRYRLNMTDLNCLDIYVIIFYDFEYDLSKKSNAFTTWVYYACYLSLRIIEWWIIQFYGNCSLDDDLSLGRLIDVSTDKKYCDWVKRKDH